MANPIGSAAALASSLGLLFVLIAVFWFVEAFASKNSNPLWWLTLLSALIRFGMGIWVGSQGLLSKGITLLIFAGIWAIMHGIGDIIRAFQLKKLGSLWRPGPPSDPGAAPRTRVWVDPGTPAMIAR